MRSGVRFALDLMWVGLSPLAAMYIRDNLIVSVPRLQEVIPYALLCVFAAAIVFAVARVHRTMWRYISLSDAFQLMAAVTIALLLALLASFTLNRLEGIPRSLPLITTSSKKSYSICYPTRLSSPLTAGA